MCSLDLRTRPGLPLFLLAALSTCAASGALYSADLQPSSAESKPAATRAPARATDPVPPEKLREDFRILRGALEEGHPGIYRYTPKPVLDRRFDQAENALDHPMNVYEFYRIVAPVVAAIKCGHTGVRVSPDLTKDKPRLPLVVRVLDGKIYVLRDLSDAQGALAGEEIRAVNGLAADKIVQTMLTAMPADGDVQTARLRRIGGSILGAAKPGTDCRPRLADINCWRERSGDRIEEAPSCARSDSRRRTDAPWPTTAITTPTPASSGRWKCSG